VCQVGYLPELYEDARSKKYRICSALFGLLPETEGSTETHGKAKRPNILV